MPSLVASSDDSIDRDKQGVSSSDSSSGDDLEWWKQPCSLKNLCSDPHSRKGTRAYFTHPELAGIYLHAACFAKFTAWYGPRQLVFSAWARRLAQRRQRQRWRQRQRQRQRQRGEAEAKVEATGSPAPGPPAPGPPPAPAPEPAPPAPGLPGPAPDAQEPAGAPQQPGPVGPPAPKPKAARLPQARGANVFDAQWLPIICANCGRLAGQYKYYGEKGPGDRDGPSFLMRCVDPTTQQMGTHTPYRQCKKEHIMNESDVVQWIRRWAGCCRRPVGEVG